MYIPKGYVGVEMPKAMIDELSKYGDPEQIIIEEVRKKLESPR